MTPHSQPPQLYLQHRPPATLQHTPPQHLPQSQPQTPQHGPQHGPPPQSPMQSTPLQHMHPAPLQQIQAVPLHQMQSTPLQQLQSAPLQQMQTAPLQPTTQSAPMQPMQMAPGPQPPYIFTGHPGSMPMHFVPHPYTPHAMPQPMYYTPVMHPSSSMTPLPVPAQATMASAVANPASSEPAPPDEAAWAAIEARFAPVPGETAQERRNRLRARKRERENQRRRERRAEQRRRRDEGRRAAEALGLSSQSQIKSFLDARERQFQASQGAITATVATPAPHPTMAPIVPQPHTMPAMQPTYVAAPPMMVAPPPPGAFATAPHSAFRAPDGQPAQHPQQQPPPSPYPPPLQQPQFPQPPSQQLQYAPAPQQPQYPQPPPPQSRYPQPSPPQSQYPPPPGTLLSPSSMAMRPPPQFFHPVPLTPLPNSPANYYHHQINNQNSDSNVSSPVSHLQSVQRPSPIKLETISAYQIPLSLVIITQRRLGHRGQEVDENHLRAQLSSFINVDAPSRAALARADYEPIAARFIASPQCVC